MKRFLTLLLIVVVVAGVAGGLYLRFGAQRVNAQTASNLSTATVQRGTLSATVNAAGNIQAAQSVALNFGQSGTVQKVNVQVGDSVKAGQVLAQLDTTDLQLSLQNAQVNLKIAQDKLAQAKNPNSAQDIANARAALASAQANYSKVTTGATPSDIAAAQASVASAQAAYTAAVNSAGTTSSQLAAAADTLQKAQVTLQQAQAAYDKVKTNPNIGAMSQSVTLQQDTIDYQNALANYQALQATSGSDANSKVQSARAALDQAQANLVKLQNQVNQNDVTAAQAQVTQAQNNLDKLLAGSDASTLDIAQNGVDQAQIAVSQAQSALQKAQVVAPFDGIVTAVNVTPGQAASTSGTTGAIQLSDLAHLQIVVNMAETDISQIKPGQTAQISLDALPDLANLTGTVSSIAPAGVVSQGVVNYPVTINLVNPPASVKTGMTANLNVVVQEADNVLMVPNRAIRTQGRSKFVTVLFEGQQIQVTVQTGLSNDTYTAVTSGLNEGDTVLLNTATTSTAGGARGGFGPGLGGVRIGG